MIEELTKPSENLNSSNMLEDKYFLHLEKITDFTINYLDKINKPIVREVIFNTNWVGFIAMLSSIILKIKYSEEFTSNEFQIVFFSGAIFFLFERIIKIFKIKMDTSIVENLQKESTQFFPKAKTRIDENISESDSDLVPRKIP